MRDAALLAGLSETAGKHALDDKTRAGARHPSDQTKQVLAKYFGDTERRATRLILMTRSRSRARFSEGHPDVLAEYQTTARHLLIDEYQDINADQHKLIKLLTGGQEAGLFAVGDDDQSIYQFRGGDPRYIRTFHTDYAEFA